MAGYVSFLGEVVGKMPGTSDFSAEDFGDYVLSQYDILGEGHFPANKNEAVLVIGGNNDVTDLTLAQLGFISTQDFVSLFEKTEEDAKNDYMTVLFNEVYAKEYVLYANDDVYTRTEETESYKPQYLFDYTGTVAKETFQDTNRGERIKITAVLRLKDGLTYGCLSSGLNLTENLIDSFIATNQNKDSTTIKELEKMDVCNYLTDEGVEQSLYNGMSIYAKLPMKTAETIFKAVPWAMLRMQLPPDQQEKMDAYLSIYGYSLTDNAYVAYSKDALNAILNASDAISGISIYTENFETKENLLSYLDAWKDEHEDNEAKQVRYDDMVGTMMTMVSTMLNAITYVLVAFTAISLIVSSVMIGIITYVSVVERTKEIGVLRSLGARKKDIKNLFNAETFVIGLASGVFGVAVTYLLSLGINAILGTLTGIYTLASLPISSALIMVAISIVLTLISGLIPAQAAAKKDPVVALRTE